MDVEGHWTPLNVNREGLPKLLIKCIISDAAGYTVSITDLTNIWTENLTPSQIVAKAEYQGCSINPGDDIVQLRILLEKIRNVLRHEEGTSVHVGVHDPDALTLALLAPLPSPLPPLEWTMTLSKALPSQLATDIIYPLIVLAHKQQNQLKYLLGQLRDKDHVMSRLLDKLESTNTDLGAVFPGVSGGRSSQRVLKRAHVAKHVRGLAPFQPGSELQHSGETPSADTLYGILRDVSGVESKSLLKPSSVEWWRDVAEHKEKVGASFGVMTDLDGDETEDDLDFQTQTLPDDLQRQRPANISSPARPPLAPLSRKPFPKSDASTDDDHVTSSPPPLPQNLFRFDTATPIPESPSKRSSTQTRRLGKIGGRSSSQAPHLSSPAKPVDTNRGARARATVSPTPPMMPPPSQPTPSKMRRLGAIGRRGSSQLQHFQSRSSSQALPDLEEELASGDSHTDAKAQSTSTAQEGLNEAHRTRSMKRKASEEPRPRETSAERADRKRAEIRQNLAAQSKPSAKRKRRF